MKRSVLLALCIPFVFSAPASADDMKQEVSKIASAYMDCFSKQDPACIAALYTKDGFIINPAGKHESRLLMPVLSRPDLTSSNPRSMRCGRSMMIPRLRWANSTSPARTTRAMRWMHRVLGPPSMSKQTENGKPEC